MQLKDMILRRKSMRSYTGEEVDIPTLAAIEEFWKQAAPLVPGIRTRIRILQRSQIHTVLPWVTPQLIAIYSEEKELWLENAGFLGQQLDLYLQSIGLGACWLGIGRTDSRTAATAKEDDPDMKFVILIAFGHPKGDATRSGAVEFHRRSLAEIADAADPRLEPARRAPSSVNSQPWYFTHEGDTLHVWRTFSLLRPSLSEMNRIDMGICLAHLYLCHPESFRFFRTEVPGRRGCIYTGSVTL